MRALVAVLVVVAAASAAHAAPWSFELPAGYREVRGLGEGLGESIRNHPDTVEFDLKGYGSPNGKVVLLRESWVFKPPRKPNPHDLERLGRGFADGTSNAQHISGSSTFVGDEVVSEVVEQTSRLITHRRQLMRPDPNDLVHVFTISCEAPPGEPMTACEHAQQTMQLTVAGPSAPAATAPRRQSTFPYLAGLITGSLLVVGIALWVLLTRRRKR